MPMNPEHLFYGIVFVKSLDMNGLIKYLSNKIDISFAAILSMIMIIGAVFVW
tara:strand:- start:274 stop:429 length:156 start_codon:yes stop_codon:yes gene_type:complete